jgi:hypothetical protein
LTLNTQFQAAKLQREQKAALKQQRKGSRKTLAKRSLPAEAILQCAQKFESAA